MDKQLHYLLEDYREYSQLFAKQIYSQEIWQEQTGCAVDEYFGYVACCENRLYNFGTWFEHTQGQIYPSGPEWGKFRSFKHSLLEFHP